MTTEKEMALKRARQVNKDSDVVDIVSCPVTDIELYFSAGSNQEFIFKSFGTCVNCDIAFHTSALKMNNGIEHCSWPVHYLGFYCKTCYSEDKEVEIVEIVKIDKLDDDSPDVDDDDLIPTEGEEPIPCPPDEDCDSNE